LTYYSLAAASSGIIFVAVLRITTQAFYSMKDTKSPVISAAVSMIVNVTLGYILMQTPLKHAGLTLANTLSAIVQMLILLTLLNKKTDAINIKKILISLIKFIIASIVMAAVIIFIGTFADWENDSKAIKIIFLTVIVFSGITIYFVLCYILKCNEMVYLADKIKQRLNPLT